MKSIEIYARCRCISNATAGHKLSVEATRKEEEDGTPVDGISITYAMYDPEGEERKSYTVFWPESVLIPGKVLCYKDFWEKYVIMEARADIAYGSFGSADPTIKAIIFPTKDKIFILTNCPVELADNVVFGGGDKAFFERIQENYPEYEEELRNRKYSTEVAIEIDPNNSISVLEAQVDLLTEVVFGLVKEDTELSGKLREILDELSLQTLKPREDLLKKVKLGKSRIRLLQCSRIVKSLKAKRHSTIEKILHRIGKPVTEDELSPEDRAIIQDLQNQINTSQEVTNKYRKILESV